MNRRSLNRRMFLRRGLASGLAAGSLCGWLETLVAAPTPRKKSVIVLWLNGGPSTIDLWDLKPRHANGGPFKEIPTTVPGMAISEHLPTVAKHGKDLILVRSMATKEGDHERATHLLRTGYVPQGAIQFPSLGGLIAREIGDQQSDLPSFISIGPTRYATTLGGGFLGPNYTPLVVGGSFGSDTLTVPNLAGDPSIASEARQGRLDLLREVEKEFARDHHSTIAKSISTATQRATRLMRPEATAAFRIEDEPDRLRTAYGRSVFGQGCLLARRLVERGVSFVEVSLDGWDTHNNNFEQVQALSTTLDHAFGTLLTDLKERGLLDSTLVVCQGEFGRTPQINGAKGRDHWPNSWSVALAGGGLKTGQVIGKTSADGTNVEERRLRVPDLIATVAKAVGIDPTKQNISNVGRPIRVADPIAEPIKELW